jgi:hypothetical protein
VYSLRPLVDSVHWHFEPWIDKEALTRAGRDFLLDNLEDLANVSDLNKVVRAYLETVAREEKAKALGYAPSDEVFYVPMVVAKLLPVALELEDALQPSYDPEADHRGGGGADYGDFVASLLDVRRAWIGTAFRNDEMRLITARFVEDWEYGHIAAAYSMDEEEVKKQIARGLRRMEEFLGGRDPRKVMEHGKQQVN